MHSARTALQLATIFIAAAVSIGALPVSQLAAASDINLVAIDAKGNVFTGGVEGRRIQKFRLPRVP